MPATPPKPYLAPTELARLASCEDRIRKGQDAFLDVAAALVEIRDERLYRGTHVTFEAYCRDRWDFSQRHANRLIVAAEVVQDLRPMGPKANISDQHPAVLPTTERQARELVAVPPAERPKVWEAAVKATDGKPTAAAVRKAADQVLVREPKPEPPPAPKLAVVNGAESADPPDVAKLRRLGAIPADVVVEIDQPDEPTTLAGEIERHEESLAKADDVPDAEWLAELPLSGQLPESRRHDFERDALLYRALDPARRRLRKAYQDACKTNRHKGETEWAYRRLLKFAHPRDWTLCNPTEKGGCGGVGTVGVIGQCPACHGRGYRVH